MYNPDKSTKKSHNDLKQLTASDELFNALPDEVIIRVFLLLDLAEIIKFFWLSKRLKQIATDNIIWEKFFQRYFHEKITIASRKKKINWLQEFSQEFATVYGRYKHSHSAESKKIFWLIVENDKKNLEKFIDARANLNDKKRTFLELRNKNFYNKSLLDLAKLLNRQNMLECIYIAFSVFLAKNKPNNYKIFHWFIECWQSINENELNIFLAKFTVKSIRDDGYFHFAAEKGDLITLQAIANKFPVFLTGVSEKNGQTAFESAAINGHVETLDWLLSNLNFLPKNESSLRIINKAIKENEKSILHSFRQQPIWFVRVWCAGCASLDWLSTADYIVKEHEIIFKNLPDPEQILIQATLKNFLFAIIENNYSHIFKLLIDLKFIKNLSDTQLEELTFFAQTKGRFNLVKKLLQHISSNSFIENNSSHQQISLFLFFRAIERGQLDLVQGLTQENPTLWNKYISGGKASLYTPLLLALAKGHKDIAQFFLEKYPQNAVMLNDVIINPDEKDKDKTALCLAIEQGFTDIALILIAKVASVSGKNSQMLPLELAIKKGDFKIVATLITFFPQLINKIKQEGTTLLNLAAQGGYSDIIELIIKKGATDTIQLGTGENNMLPIHIAAQAGRFNVILTLLKHDLQAFLRLDRCERSPLHLALIHGHKTVAAYLAQQYLIDLQSNKTSRKVKTIINTTINNLDPEHAGKTQLYLAAEKGYYEIVTDLLNAGASAQLDEGAGKARLQPIHIAAQNGHLQVIEVLQNCQPEQIKLTDKQGWTPLMHAAVNKQGLIVEYLLRSCNSIPEENEYKNKGLGQEIELILALKIYIAKRLAQPTKNGQLFHLLDQYINAAQALIAVITGDAKLDTLKQHETVLNTNELANIYSEYLQSINKSTYAEKLLKWAGFK